MQVVPAILEKTPEKFIFQFKKLKPYFNQYQIDIADGKLVPNKTIQIEEIIKIFKRLTCLAGRQALNVESYLFDFHLMVKDYKKEIKKLINLKKYVKIKNILIHYSVCNPKDYNLLATHYSLFSIGLVLDPPDQISDLAEQYKLDKIPFIQIMTINPGFQGTPFIPELLNKIEQLRLLGYRNKILIDGSVNDKTIPLILAKKFRPDILGIGSFLSKAESVPQRLAFLKKIGV